MTATIIKPKPNLENFLKLPESKPASEFIDGEIIQKDMSEIQLELTAEQIFNWLNFT